MQVRASDYSRGQVDDAGTSTMVENDLPSVPVMPCSLPVWVGSCVCSRVLAIVAGILAELPQFRE
jgi:hypothetical protein